MKVMANSADERSKYSPLIRMRRPGRRRDIVSIYVDKYAEWGLLVTSAVKNTSDLADFICLECGCSFSEIFNSLPLCPECNKKSPA